MAKKKPAPKKPAADSAPKAAVKAEPKEFAVRFIEDGVNATHHYRANRSYVLNAEDAKRWIDAGKAKPAR